MGLPAQTDMLILARESRGLTQSQLSEATGISQANISKYEVGLLSVSEEHLRKIAEALEYPISFFYLSEQRYGFGSGCTYHRKRQTMPVHELKTLLAQINIHRIRISRLLNGAEIESDNLFQRLDIEDYEGDVEKIATIVRQAWRLPMGPISNLVDAIENAGGLVFMSDFETKKLDAISQWVRGLPPIFFTNSETPGDRLRFTLAHELGHVFMHKVPTENMEEEADRFAAEFLMPAREIGPDLGNLTLPKLANLKAYWKVSMAALIMRAYRMEKITHRQYRTIFEQLSKSGYRIKEPVYIPLEKPHIVKELVDLHKEEYGYDTDQMCGLLVINEREYRTMPPYSDRQLRIVS